MPESPQTPQSAALPRGWIEVEYKFGILRAEATSIKGIMVGKTTTWFVFNGELYELVGNPDELAGKIAAAGEPVQPKSRSQEDYGLGYGIGRNEGQSCGIKAVAAFVHEESGPALASLIRKSFSDQIALRVPCDTNPFASGFAAGVEAAEKELRTYLGFTTAGSKEFETINFLTNNLNGLTPPKGGDGDGPR